MNHSANLIPPIALIWASVLLVHSCPSGAMLSYCSSYSHCSSCGNEHVDSHSERTLGPEKPESFMKSRVLISLRALIRKPHTIMFLQKRITYQRRLAHPRLPPAVHRPSSSAHHSLPRSTGSVLPQSSSGATSLPPWESRGWIPLLRSQHDHGLMSNTAPAIPHARNLASQFLPDPQ